MSFDNTKYDVQLNGVGYRIRGYQKSEQDTFIPRLSSGDQNESEFDLLRAKTIKGFEGGSLQRNWQDDTSVFASEGLYPIYEDGSLYPVSSAFTYADTIIGKSAVAAKVFSKDYLFIAYRSYNTPTNYIKRIDSSGTVTVLTLPANLSSSTKFIHDMVIWNNQLWISCSDNSSTGSLHYMSLSSTTVTEVTAGTAYYHKMAIWKGSLYGTNAGTGSPNYYIYKYTGDTTTKSTQLVATVPTLTGDETARLFVYNNRLLLSRLDGLWAWDGVQLAPIEDMTKNIDIQNFRFPTVLRGYLYYFMPDGMYRYNGSMIEKLYDISEIGFPYDMCAGINRLWILFNNGATTGSSRYDKSMGYDYASGNNIDGRVMVYNGKGIFTYARLSTWVKNPATEDFSGQGIFTDVIYFSGRAYVFSYYDKNSTSHAYISTVERSLTGTKAWRIHTSIFDGEFPMIDKNLDNIELTFDGYIPSDETITLEYRTVGFDGSTGWTSLGTILTTSKLKEYVFKNVPAGISFKKIQLRAYGTTTVGYGISRFVIRYTLSPEVKWQWQATFLCYGDQQLEPLLFADGTESTQSVGDLRGNLYAVRNSVVPVNFIDVDKIDLAEDLTNSETLVDITGLEMLKSSKGFFQIDDEIFYYTSKTATTATCVRGSLGTTAVTHTTGAKVFPLYRVIIRKFQNERIEMSDRDDATTTDKHRQSEITLMIQEL